MKKIIIVAVAKNMVIGTNQLTIPWENKEDFKHFKATTLGYPIVMGKNTFLSLGKPLKGRTNIVIAADLDNLTVNEDFVVVSSIQDSFSEAEKYNNEKLFICGGGSIYEQTLANDWVDEMIISHLDFEAEGEVKFPEINLTKWEITERVRKTDFEIVYYKRKS